MESSSNDKKILVTKDEVKKPEKKFTAVLDLSGNEYDDDWS